MPILGVVVTHPKPDELRSALADNVAVARVGTPVRDRLPLVLFVAHHDEDYVAIETIRSLPGVFAVDLAFADFSDEVQQ